MTMVKTLGSFVMPCLQHSMAAKSDIGYDHQLGKSGTGIKLLPRCKCPLLTRQSGFLAILDASSANLTLGDGRFLMGCNSTGTRVQCNGSQSGRRCCLRRGGGCCVGVYIGWSGP